MLKLLWPATSKCVTLNYTGRTRVRLTLMAVRLQRHARAHGRYPADIKALARPDDPAPFTVDPMSGEPFRYRVEPDGRVRLWSVWRNQTDEGGKAEKGWSLESGIRGKENDAVIELPPPGK